MTWRDEQGTQKQRLFAVVSVNGGNLAAAVARAAAMYHQRLGYAADTARVSADLAPDSPEIHGLQVEITTALSHPRRQVWVYRQQPVSAGTGN